MARLKKNKKKASQSKRSASAFSSSTVASSALAIAICVRIFLFSAGTKPDLSNLPFPPVNKSYDMALLVKQVGMAYRRELIKLKNEELNAIKANKKFVACALNTNYGVCTRLRSNIREYLRVSSSLLRQAKFDDMGRVFPKKAEKLKKLGLHTLALRIVCDTIFSGSCKECAN